MKHRAATAARTREPKSKYRQPLMRTCYLHTVIDDHSRVAYVEAHDDETRRLAGVELVVVGDGAPAHQGRDDRHAGQLRQRDQQLGRVGVDDAATGDDERAPVIWQGFRRMAPF
jgi:hypothetical protein